MLQSGVRAVHLHMYHHYVCLNLPVTEAQPECAPACVGP
jgi:hypothetical protein